MKQKSMDGFYVIFMVVVGAMASILLLASVYLSVRLMITGILLIKNGFIDEFISLGKSGMLIFLAFSGSMVVTYVPEIFKLIESNKRTLRPKYHTVVYYFEDGVTKILSRDVYADSSMKAYDMMIDYACFSDWRGQGAGIGYRGIIGYTVTKVKE